MRSHQPAHILLVEDSPSDAVLMTETFKDLGIQARFTHVSDGLEALAYLRGDSGSKARLRSDTEPAFGKPDIILLDLNLPRMDGRELLCLLKSDPEFRPIPVIVLSTSNADRDISYCYEHYANCYLTKPVDLESFNALASSINQFWLTKAVLPS